MQSAERSGIDPRDRASAGGARAWVGMPRRIILAALVSRPERARPQIVRARLIATLFGRASNVLMVALAAAICGAASWSRGGGWTTAAVAVFEVVLLSARCLVILAYQRRARLGDIFDPEGWLAVFGGLAILSSCCWGAMCLVALAGSHDPVLMLLPVLSTVGTAGAVAARNSAVPRLVAAQLACSLIPILVGSLLAADAGMRLLLLLVPAMALGLEILVVERNGQLVALIETRDELTRLSETDPLTALANRRTFDARMLETRFAARPVALLMIDVDHFKAFNDRHGHPAGDALLRQLAGVLGGELRKTDLLARYGGEEFAALLHDVDAVAAAAMGERLRSAVAAACRDPADGSAVTVSVGVAAAAAPVEHGRLLEEADRALYEGKRSGRNRVIAFEALLAA